MQNINKPLDVVDDSKNIKVNTIIQKIRSQIVNRIFQFISIAVVPTLAGSLYRIVDIGWQPVMTLHVSITIVILLTTIFRKMLAFHIRAVLLISIYLLVSIGGYVNLGLMGGGIPFSIFCIFLAVSLYGYKGGFITLGIIIFTTLLTAYGFLQEILSIEDVIDYHKKGSTWIGVIVTLSFLSVTGIALIGSFQSELAKMMIKLDKANEELDNAYQIENKKNIEKTNFLSTMSHEIRTPLNGILGVAQLMKESNLNKEQMSLIKTVINSGNILLGLLNNILDMNKIESGKIYLDYTPVKFLDLVEKTVQTFDYEVRNKDLDLLKEFEIDPNLVVKSDRVRLQQIIVNLIGNAIKFTKEGHVKIACSKIYVSNEKITDKKDITIRLSVSDTGKGIEYNQISNIFDVFQQEDSSITREFGGSGLGLTITKNIIELMGGSIEVSSQVNRGTKFDVYIPFDVDESHNSNNKVANSSKDGSKSKRNLKILLVEDNSVNALIFIALLEKEGHTVDHAENGKIAVDNIMKKKYDIVFMDIHMPILDGVEATKLVRNKYSMDILPIVGLTADAFSDRHTLFRQAGMNDVVTKPFSKDEINFVIDNLFSEPPTISYYHNEAKAGQ